MRRVLPAIVVLLAMGATQAVAQTQSTAQSDGSVVSPRTPGGVSAGATPANQTKMNQTVQGIGQKLLDQEKDRPRLPGQTPSPSQTMPGGTASGGTAGTPR
jgi:hypothetical protein